MISGRRAWFAASMLLFAASGGEANAQTNPNVGRWLDRYATITGAWHLNQRCRVLTDVGSRELDWHVSNVGAALHRRLNSTPLLTSIPRGAREAANRPPYSQCGQESRNVVNQAMPMARALSRELTGQSYTPAQDDAKLTDWTNRFMQVARAWHINQQCRVLEDARRQEFEWHVMTVTTALQSKQVSPVVLGQLQMRERDVASQPEYRKCQQVSRELVMLGFYNARAWSFELTGRRYVPRQ